MIELANKKSTPESKTEKENVKNVDLNENINDSELEQSIDSDSPESNQNENTAEQLAAEKDKYLRLAAEYDNFRKRSAKEREMTYSSARTDVISKLLPVYDNLERALKMECTDESFYKGVEMIMTQLTETLNDMGVEVIPAVGQPFDPNRHNAVMSVDNPDFKENTIVEEYQKGFMLGDRVIRFSTVVVAN